MLQHRCSCQTQMCCYRSRHAWAQLYMLHVVSCDVWPCTHSISAGAHLETRVLALLKRMQTASQVPPARPSKSKQSRLPAHLAPRPVGRAFALHHTCCSIAVSLHDDLVNLPNACLCDVSASAVDPSCCATLCRIVQRGAVLCCAASVQGQTCHGTPRCRLSMCNKCRQAVTSSFAGVA